MFKLQKNIHQMIVFCVSVFSLNCMADIYLPDSRSQVEVRQHPAIVKVYGDIAGNCTGAMLAPRLVLTAAHCVEQHLSSFAENKAQKPSFYDLTKYPIRVLSAYQDESFADMAFVKEAYWADKISHNKDIHTNPAKDWVLLLVDRDLISVQDALPLLSMADESFLIKSQYTIVSYPYDIENGTRMMNSGTCQVFGQQKTSYGLLLLHNCDTWWGSSGAPLLTQIDGKQFIVGVHIGGDSRIFAQGEPFDFEHSNRAVSSTTFYEKIEFLKKTVKF